MNANFSILLLSGNRTETKHLENLEKLIEIGFNVNTTDGGSENTLLHYAAKKGK